MSCFSLHPLKNLNILGDGGVITTGNKSYMNACYYKIMVYKEDLYKLGLNSRLDELQAAFALTRLKDIDITNQRFGEIASIYRRIKTFS